MMESPPYLFEQFAKKHGLSKEMAKKALLLKAYSEEGKTIRQSASLVGIAVDSAKRVSRKMLIDFTDWRPYARLEKLGQKRPSPGQRDIAMPVKDLPLFS